MAYQFERDNMYYYDVYPKVVAAHKEVEIHIRSLGGRAKFQPGKEYQLLIIGLEGGYPDKYPQSSDAKWISVVADEQGGFTFANTFDHEQEYWLRVEETVDGQDEPRKLEEFQVYCVDGDLVGRYPFIGDLHVHSTRSDGREAPEVVCANYRCHGYDFMAITDHRRYYPSLQAMRAYQDVPTEITLVPGEEVHMPALGDNLIYPHVVNFGGLYSINALVEGEATEEVGAAVETRSVLPECPPVMTKEEFWAIIHERMKTIDVPDNVSPMQAAGVEWVYNRIREAGGLAIYPHPTWITNSAYHVADPMHDYQVENKMFDAFEVLGGENYYEQNGFQTSLYYEEYKSGRVHPIVGSTDSHNSTENNRNARICSTIVFAHENERTDIIASVKDKYSVAVDTISAEYRLVGEHRLQKYACFLMEEFYPLHDRIAKTDGELMRRYYLGEIDGALLDAAARASVSMFDKYFLR